jgi:aspartyl-tRNA(Asn)/glutamyl-tRNA(Gln) amidotransferase subunit B
MREAFEAIRAAGPALPAKEVANLVTGLAARVAKAAGYNGTGIPGEGLPADVAALLAATGAGAVSRAVGRELLERHLAEGTPAAELLAGAGPGPIADDASLLRHVDAVIAANPRAVADYGAGKPVVGFFVGQVMKATAGAADAARVTQLVRERLDAES